MASSEWARELKLLEDPKMRAWVERSANLIVGELVSEGRFEPCQPGVRPAPDPVEGACSQVASAQPATGDDRRHITYRQTLDFVGDDRAAGRVISRVALFFNHTLLANDSLPKGGYIC
jgi:hypothetical protein